MKKFLSIAVVALAAGLSGCAGNAEKAPPSTEAPDPAPAVMPADTVAARVFSGRGVVKNITPSKDYIVIDHEVIAGYMNAMTMPFPLQDPALVEGISRGDSVRFELTVAGSEAQVSKVTRIR